VLDRCFLTGADKNTEWQLEWFFKNYHEHNHMPIAFCDFGVSKEAHDMVLKYTDCIFCLSDAKEQGWFKKPRAMLNCPSKETVWLDTDCEIRGNISGIFNTLKSEKLSMVLDRPWTKRRKSEWYNSGVVGFQGKPMILKEWVEAVKHNPIVGDQEVLDTLLLDSFRKRIYIEEIHNKYNYLRLQILDDKKVYNPLVMHWTGSKGNIEIEKQIKQWQK
jgi:hypothetical protein